MHMMQEIVTPQLEGIPNEEFEKRLLSRNTPTLMMMMPKRNFAEAPSKD